MSLVNLLIMMGGVILGTIAYVFLLEWVLGRKKERRYVSDRRRCELRQHERRQLDEPYAGSNRRSAERRVAQRRIIERRSGLERQAA